MEMGLREKDAKIYLALLRLGESSVGAIANATGIRPRTVYDSLNSLVQGGLVGVSEKEGVKQYAAANPHALLSLSADRMAAAEAAVAELEEVRAKETEPLVRVFRGKGGIKSVFEDQLREGKTVYYYGGAMQGARIFVKDYYKIYDAKRLRRRIPVKMIFIDKPEVRDFISRQELFEGRSIPEQHFANVVWWLYGNKMAIVFWREEPLAILIEDEELARVYKNFFNIVWKTAKPFRKSPAR
jgi:sugar-specific transcriptional regulator TrmB